MKRIRLAGLWLKLGSLLRGHVAQLAKKEKIPLFDADFPGASSTYAVRKRDITRFRH